ncbi:hypothetical protein WR25_24324 isoform C [Diploscapter pachys]|uniref:Uncharacterized protein n=1 Tax=Diploscapter pachys TaxID=2018661 RepID=A0A2A2M037_9BILA|nr:hypothetical protein WR25_24324 isoform C [Diploscapter pachys]
MATRMVALLTKSRRTIYPRILPTPHSRPTKIPPNLPLVTGSSQDIPYQVTALPLLNKIQRNAIPACLRYMKPYGQRFRKSSRNLGILQVNIDFMDLKKISRLTKFVDDCAEAHISGSRSAPVVHCPTICVSLYETPNIGGFRIQGHIRGCMSDILLNGFHQSIVCWYRWMHRDSCRTYRKRELFKLSGIEDDSTIEVCTCYADFCNGHSTGVSVTFTMLIAPILIALTQALF